MDQEAKDIQYPEIAEELLKLSEEDEQHIFDKDSTKRKNIIERNTARLKEIVDQIGWPTIPKVGFHASHAAHMISQHSDHDREFQKYVIKLMKDLPEGEVRPRNIAYLDDRIARAEGKLQKYGTQLGGTDEYITIGDDVEDPENIDKRRAKVGLEPMAEYVKKSAKYYGVDYKIPDFLKDQD